MSFKDRIAKLCLEKFDRLPKKGKPQQHEWTVLSCIVLENSDNLDVVALGTGTKCIGEDKLSNKGDILNDSHAEIICRRAFLRYIYENILHKTFLYKFDPVKQKFQLKLDLKFHFFSTQVPCGDAAIFAKQDESNFGHQISGNTDDILLDRNSLKRSTSSSNENANKKTKLDIYRTGAKCLKINSTQDLKLEGENYHVVEVVRTKPGRGIPTLSVSCSDKIAKWGHLGIQGALLSLLIDHSIYFSSMTFAGGIPFDEAALRRALFERLKCKPLFPANMLIEQCNLQFLYRKEKEKEPCPTSIAWYNAPHTTSQVEVSVNGFRQGVTKKQLQTAGATNVCKRELFHLFLSIVKQFSIKIENHTVDKLSYKEAKLLSKNYQHNWAALKTCFSNWTKKNEDLQEFYVD